MGCGKSKSTEVVVTEVKSGSGEAAESASRPLKEAAHSPATEGEASPLRAAAEAAATKGIQDVAVFSARPYDVKYLDEAVQQAGSPFKMQYIPQRLTEETAKLAAGCQCVCIFVNDDCNSEVVPILADLGVKMIALRCAGFNNVALDVAQARGITVARVPAYSPHAVAEHASALCMSLNRKIPNAYAKTRAGNFSLVGQLGMDMHGKKLGIIGTGLIGSISARIFKEGFECDVVASDVRKNPKIADPPPAGLGIPYVELDELFATCDIISLHAPLLPATRHMINSESISKMKDGVLIINTSRGGLIDTQALINGLKEKKIGGAGLDVVEEEGDCFFEDGSEEGIADPVLNRLIQFPNVIVTAHQAFFTVEALKEISAVTVQNVSGVSEKGEPPKQRGALETLVKPPPA